MSIEVATVDGRTAFEPGETIEVEARWELESRCERIELRVVWYTEGKGDQDVGVAQCIERESPPPTDTWRTSLELPDAPYSFSGKLISLIWAVELIALPRGGSHRLDITIGPDAREVLLQATGLDDDDSLDSDF